MHNIWYIFQFFFGIQKQKKNRGKKLLKIFKNWTAWSQTHAKPMYNHSWSQWPPKKIPHPKLFKSTLHRSPSPKLRYIIFERLYMWTLPFTIWPVKCPKAIIIRCRVMRPLLCIIYSIYSQIFCAWAFGRTFQLILDGGWAWLPRFLHVHVATGFFNMIGHCITHHCRQLSIIEL